MTSIPIKRRQFEKTSQQRSISLVVDEVVSSHGSPDNQQIGFPQDYEEEADQVLENLGTLFEELGQFENLHTPTPSTSPHSSHHTETLPSSENEREIKELEGKDFSAAKT